MTQLKQHELHKQQQLQAQRLLRAQQQDGAHCAPRRDQPRRRTAACTVRVNNLHAAEAIETDVWPIGELRSIFYFNLIIRYLNLITSCLNLFIPYFNYVISYFNRLIRILNYLTL